MVDARFRVRVDPVNPKIEYIGTDIRPDQPKTKFAVVWYRMQVFRPVDYPMGKDPIHVELQATEVLR